MHLFFCWRVTLNDSTDFIVRFFFVILRELNKITLFIDFANNDIFSINCPADFLFLLNGRNDKTGRNKIMNTFVTAFPDLIEFPFL